MDENFWRRKWQRNEIAFHEGKANRLLVANFKFLSLPKGARVFLPLCGKTRDIHWLLSSGYRVVGAELSEMAIGQLFEELGVRPTISGDKRIGRYGAEGIDILVGDIFNVSRDDLGRVDAVYDRAALVALPETDRGRYAAHLMEIADRAPQLLISYEYDQRLLAGPPFSVTYEEVARRYQASYDLKLLASADVAGGLKGKCAATENIWLLTPRDAPN
ncbi:MAG TPA: thiopurine S-methyltransferase [Roseiarcus sp.]|nr:thiopurine S-methyltransferase [Roseiarcus sp.]